MILGQTRTPLDRPAAASGSFQPKLPHTGFYSHFHPLTMVTHAMRSQPGMYRPPLPGPQGPQMLPSVPAPVAPTVPTPGGTAGFGGSGFGSTGGVKMHHGHVDPYTVMRSGMIPGVSPSGSNIRAGIHHAGARVQRSMPFQTAPLPPDMPPPAPVMPMPAPAATHGFFGAFGAPMHHRKRRHWLSRMITPETVSEVSQREASDPSGCETYPPRADGIKVTVCNGRVVKYEDANGNVNQPDPNSGSEFGHPGHHGHHHHRHHQEQVAMAGLGYGFQNRWGARGGVPGGGWANRFQPPAYGQQPGLPGAMPYHHRHHHHAWPPAAPAPAPVPAFGRYW